MKHAEALLIGILVATTVSLPVRAATVTPGSDRTGIDYGPATLDDDFELKQSQGKRTTTTYPAGTTSSARGGDSVTIAATDIGTTTPTPGAIPVAGSSSTLDVGWMPTKVVTSTATGTSTTNIVPKWDAAGGLTLSRLFDNGTNIGIGTTAPLGPLELRFDNTNYLSPLNAVMVHDRANSGDQGAGVTFASYDTVNLSYVGKIVNTRIGGSTSRRLDFLVRAGVNTATFATTDIKLSISDNGGVQMYSLPGRGIGKVLYDTDGAGTIGEKNLVATDVGAMPSPQQVVCPVGSACTGKTDSTTSTATATGTGTFYATQSQPLSSTVTATSTNSLCAAGGLVWNTTSTSTHTPATVTSTTTQTTTNTSTGTATGAISGTTTATSSASSTAVATLSATSPYSRTFTSTDTWNSATFAGDLLMRIQASAVVTGTATSTQTGTGTGTATGTGTGTATVSGIVTVTSTTSATNSAYVSFDPPQNLTMTVHKTATGPGTATETYGFTGTVSSTGTQSQTSTTSTASATGTGSATLSNTNSVTSTTTATSTATGTQTTTETATGACASVASNPTVSGASLLQKPAVSCASPGEALTYVNGITSCSGVGNVLGTGTIYSMPYWSSSEILSDSGIGVNPSYGTIYPTTALAGNIGIPGAPFSGANFSGTINVGTGTVINGHSSADARTGTCGSGQFVNGTDGDGNLSCSTPSGTGSGVTCSGTCSSPNWAVFADSAHVTNAAYTPASTGSCPAGQYASGLTSSGPTCSTPSGSGTGITCSGVCSSGYLAGFSDSTHVTNTAISYAGNNIAVPGQVNAATVYTTGDVSSEGAVYGDNLTSAGHAVQDVALAETSSGGFAGPASDASTSSTSWLTVVSGSVTLPLSRSVMLLNATVTFTTPAGHTCTAGLFVGSTLIQQQRMSGPTGIGGNPGGCGAGCGEGTVAVTGRYSGSPGTHTVSLRMHAGGVGSTCYVLAASQDANLTYLVGPSL